MPRMISALKAFLKGRDQFSTSQFVSYKGLKSYQTLTGGVISVLILIIIAVLGINETIKMIRKEVITTTMTISAEANPPNITIQFNNQNAFMMAITITDSANHDYYDDIFAVKANQINIIGNQTDYMDFPFIKCSEDHFKYNDQILRQAKSLNLHTNAYCPQLNNRMSVGGRINYRKFSRLEVNLYGTGDFNKFNAIINRNPMFAQIVMTFYLINTVINPSSKDYYDSVIDGRNYFFINKHNCTLVQAQITHYTILTDNSQMPYKDIEQEEAVSIPYELSSKIIPFVGFYATINITKDAESYIYNRSYVKIDTVLSYVGGLIGVVISVFFVLKNYSGTSFLISLAHRLFTFDHRNDINSRRFNVLSYLKIIVKGWLQKLGCKEEWENTEKFEESANEMNEQVSIQLILEQLAYLQAAISSILTEDQRKALFLTERRSVADVRSARKQFRATRCYFFEKQMQNQDKDQELEKDNNDNSRQKQNNIKLKDSLQQLQTQKQVNIDASKQTMQNRPKEENKSQSQNNLKKKQNNCLLAEMKNCLMSN